MEKILPSQVVQTIFSSHQFLSTLVQRFELIVSGLEQVQQHIPYPLTSQMIDTFKSEL